MTHDAAEKPRTSTLADLGYSQSQIDKLSKLSATTTHDIAVHGFATTLKRKKKDLLKIKRQRREQQHQK